jgi:hypothetical protein
LTAGVHDKAGHAPAKLDLVHVTDGTEVIARGSTSLIVARVIRVQQE